MSASNGFLASLSAADGWIVGHAAQTGRIFTQGTPRMFAHGAFRDIAGSPVVLGIDHQPCRCFDPGRSIAEPLDQLIRPDLVLASSATGSLLFEEDTYGLFFAARFRRDACVGPVDGPIANIHAAIAAGQCHGVSIHHHGGEQVCGRDGIPEDVAVWAWVRVVEVSLCFSTPPGSPGTWVMPAGPLALAEREFRVGGNAHHA